MKGDAKESAGRRREWINWAWLPSVKYEKCKQSPQDMYFFLSFMYHILFSHFHIFISVHFNFISFSHMHLLFCFLWFYYILWSCSFVSKIILFLPFPPNFISFSLYHHMSRHPAFLLQAYLPEPLYFLHGYKYFFNRKVVLWFYFFEATFFTREFSFRIKHSLFL